MYGSTPARWPARYLRMIEILGGEVSRIEAEQREQDRAVRSTAAGAGLMRGLG